MPGEGQSPGLLPYLTATLLRFTGWADDEIRVIIRRPVADLATSPDGTVLIQFITKPVASPACHGSALLLFGDTINAPVVPSVLFQFLLRKQAAALGALVFIL